MAIVITKKSGKYQIDRDAHCFTLSKYIRTTDTYDIIGYYSDLYYAIKHLVNLGIVEHGHLENISEIVKATCESLALSVNKALKAPQNVKAERSLIESYEGSVNHPTKH